jgi:hypothetical protein
MTRLELITKVLADYSGKPETELTAWAENNLDPQLTKNLQCRVPKEQAEELLAEYRANPSSVIALFARQLGKQPPQSRNDLN